MLTGPERAAVLIGPAGTGKGVVIDATARAEQLAGHETIGIAIAGSTAERLGTDSPALHENTMTLDSLIARANTGRVHMGPDTTVILDEAGMADHARLDALTELVERSGAKLIAVGDGQQLPSIGPGGMFDRLTNHAPTVELQAIHRTKDPAEQRAWQALRAGEPERAMAHYASRGALHLTNTRDQAAEAAVQAWAQLAREHDDIREVALIADASNQEIDRLNARAQHLRAQRGELGQRETPLPHVHYGIREGDLIAFTRQHRPPGKTRVENGTRGEITALHPNGSATITLDGSNRRIALPADDLDALRLAYAQHVYRQQGATVERSIVLTGGWQPAKRPPTSRRPAPANAPTGISPETTSAKTDKTPNASHYSPSECAAAAGKRPRSPTKSHPTSAGSPSSTPHDFDISRNRLVGLTASRETSTAHPTTAWTVDADPRSHLVRYSFST